MTKAFLFGFAIAAVLIWIFLAIEHGGEAGKFIKETIKRFKKGK